MKHRLVLLQVCLLILLLSGLTGCSQKNNGLTNQTKNKQQLSVVTSLDFYGETAQAVLGNKGKAVSVINNDGIDPHDFQPTTQTAKAVAKADVIIYNGLNYDSWMGKLAENNSSAQVIRVGEDVLQYSSRANPHVWYQTGTLPRLAEQLVKIYGRLQPQNKKYFKNNARKYQRKLIKLKYLVEQLRTHSQGRLVAVSEPVFNYSLKEMGYRISDARFAKAIEDGADPAPQAIKQLQSQIKQQRLAFFVENSQASDQTVKNIVSLAKKYHVPIVKVTETKPKDKTYEQWMFSQDQQVAKIQQAEEKR